MEDVLVYWSSMILFAFGVLLLGMIVEWVSRLNGNGKDTNQYSNRKQKP